MVNYLFNELTGQQFDGGFILADLYTAAKNVLIRCEPVRGKKAGAAAAGSSSAVDDDQQQQQAAAKGGKGGIGELFKATRNSIRKLAESAQEILDADDDAAAAAATAASYGADNDVDSMEVDDIDDTSAAAGGGSSTKVTTGNSQKSVPVTPEVAARIQSEEAAHEKFKQVNFAYNCHFGMRT
jgi:hypothetical protein